MSTFADVIAAAEALEIPAYPHSNVVTYLDSSTPSGTFCGTCKVLGITTTYLMRGDKNDPRATILGRIEVTARGHANSYVGNGIKGGNLIPADTTESAFAAMLMSA